MSIIRCGTGLLPNIHIPTQLNILNLTLSISWSIDIYYAQLVTQEQKNFGRKSLNEDFWQLLVVYNEWSEWSANHLTHHTISHKVMIHFYMFSTFMSSMGCLLCK